MISERVTDLAADAIPLEQRSTYGKAFLQITNLWTKSDEVKAFVFGKRLARIAAESIGATGVRMYHDQALYKEAGGGITPWHADQYYWPVSSDRIVMVWIPLQDTPKEMGPLAFCEKSHQFQIGRDLEISDESEMMLKEALHAFHTEDSAFELGDVSFHAGWTLHCAGANRKRCRSGSRPRLRGPRSGSPPRGDDGNLHGRGYALVAPRNKHQVVDTETWCPGVRCGEVIASPLNPVLYSARYSDRVTG